MTIAQLAEIATSRRELNLAERAMQQIASASDMQTMLAAWQNFLHMIKQAWEKVVPCSSMIHFRP